MRRLVEAAVGAITEFDAIAEVFEDNVPRGGVCTAFGTRGLKRLALGSTSCCTALSVVVFSDGNGFLGTGGMIGECKKVASFCTVDNVAREN